MYFKGKIIKKDKEGILHYIQEKMNQEHVTILNIHVPFTSTLNFINLDLNTQINSNSVMVGSFIIPTLYNDI